MKHVSFLVLLTSICFSFATAQPTGLSVGDTAPDFSGINQQGKKIQLSEALKSRPVVLLFYRGEWCPYCNQQLKAIQDSLKFMTDKGATIIAVTPETSDNRDLTIEKTKATFNIISDEHTKIMQAYKVAFELDGKTTEAYKGYGIVLPEKNGTNGNQLPVPAVYIINQDGKISYVHFNADYTKRASVKEIVEHL